MKNKNSFWRLWGKPLALGLVTLTGLLSALIGDHLWDGLSWLLLSIPVVLMVFFIYRNKAF